MNITEKTTDRQTSLVTISLDPGDYQPSFEQSVKKARKQMSMPGFRPGHVPEGLIRKKYGKALLIEELNKIVSESLDRYIHEQKLKILGRPLPHANGAKNDFDTPAAFEFSFELGLVPEFVLTIPPRHVFTEYLIEIDTMQVEEEVSWLRERFGEMQYPEVSDEDSYLAVEVAELGPENEAKTDGYKTTTRFRISDVKDGLLKKDLPGRKAGDSVIYEIREGADPSDGQLILGMEKVFPAAGARYLLRITLIANREIAGLDQSFFDKVFGEGTVGDQEAFYERIKAGIERSHRQQSEQKLAHDVEDELLHAAKIELPDTFLKRWLMEEDERALSPEELEKQYGAWARGMQWRMIRQRIMQENQLTITEEEIKQYAGRYMASRLAEYSDLQLTNELVEQAAARYLSKDENRMAASEELSRRKVFEWLIPMVQKKEKKVSLEEFRKIIREHSHAH